MERIGRQEFKAEIQAQRPGFRPLIQRMDDEGVNAQLARGALGLRNGAQKHLGSQPTPLRVLTHRQSP